MVAKVAAFFGGYQQLHGQVAATGADLANLATRGPIIGG